MILRSSPDGRAYGRYVHLGGGQFGFLPIILAALPTILQIANPPPPPVVPPYAPPSNTPLLFAAGVGGLLVLGGLTYILVKA